MAGIVIKGLVFDAPVHLASAIFFMQAVTCCVRAEGIQPLHGHQPSDKGHPLSAIGLRASGIANEE